MKISFTFALLCLATTALSAEADARFESTLPLTDSAQVIPTTVRVVSTGQAPSSQGSDLTIRQTAELALFETLRLGLKVQADWNESTKFTPTVQAKLQFLKQERLGINLAIGTRYKQVGLNANGGELETFLAGSRTFGRLLLAANAVYGIEMTGGGSDFEGKLGVLYSLNDRWSIGFDSRLIAEMNDAAEAASGNIEVGHPIDLVAGPLLAMKYGTLDASLLAGARLAKGSTKVDPFAQLSIGFSF